MNRYKKETFRHQLDNKKLQLLSYKIYLIKTNVSLTSI